ncbi:MAG: protein-L-isoaspartate(D-aspartate) O-methyltransferase [Paracoccaceae bacterium]
MASREKDRPDEGGSDGRARAAARDEGVARMIMDLRRAGGADKRVLDAMESVPRRHFVGPAFDARAYDDTALPIDCGQTISQPAVVALMTEALGVGERDKVLEIGAGSGYQSAVLARLARRVYAIERHRPLVLEARARLNALGIGNVALKAADGTRGWPEQAPFDRILIAAAAEDVPTALLEQLRPGGIMIVPVGQSDDVQHLIRAERRADGGADYRELGAVRFVPLVEGMPDDGEGRTARS